MVLKYCCLIDGVSGWFVANIYSGEDMGCLSCRPLNMMGLFPFYTNLIKLTTKLSLAFAFTW